MKALMAIVALSVLLLSIAPHAAANEPGQEGLKFNESAPEVYMPSAKAANGEIVASEAERNIMDREQLRPEVREPAEVSSGRGD